MKLITLVVVCLTFAFIPMSSAQVYKWVAADGTVMLTNIKPDWWTDEMNDVFDYREIQPPSDWEPTEGETEEEAAGGIEEVTGGVISPERHESNEFRFVGDKTTRKVHRDDCPDLREENGKGRLKIPFSDVEVFDDLQKALETGYKPCETCNPDEKN